MIYALPAPQLNVPVLRKDFTVDARDIADARLMGADAVLLIVAAFPITNSSVQRALLV